MLYLNEVAWCPERLLPSECKKSLFCCLIKCSKLLIISVFLCRPQDGFASLGTVFCPKTRPKRDLCLPGSWKSGVARGFSEPQ